MTNFWQGIGHVVVTGIVVTLTALNGSVPHPVVFPAAPQPAMIATTTNATTSFGQVENQPIEASITASTTSPVIAPPNSAPATSTPGASSSVSMPPVPLPQPISAIAIKPGLLPSVILKKITVAQKATSTASLAAGAATPNSTPSVAPSAVAKIKTPPQSTITAQWVLNNTTTTFQVVYGGSYKASLVTMVNGQAVSWGFDATSFGGTAGIPLMTAAISCNPPPSTDVDSGDLLFNVASSYACTISLTPLTGNDRRIQSKTFSFTTPSGQLTVSRASSMNTVLVNGEDDGGIVFTNTDPNPITVTGLVLNVSYSYLSTTTTPLVLRLFKPGTNIDLSDYHLESLPAETSSAYMFGQANMNASVVFTIPGSSQKMLPVAVFGVTKMLMSGTSPNITVGVDSITTDRSDIKTTLNRPTITWSCDVVLGNYNPDDPDASQECHN